MGKIRTRTIGVEEVEKEQKTEQKKRSQEKKVTKKADVAVVTEAPVETPKVEKKTSKVKKEVVVSKVVRGKKYAHAATQVDPKKNYSLQEAVKILKSIKYTSFDESVELHMNVTEEGLKGEIALPHSIGKTVRVAIVDDKLLDQLANGKIEFDILVTHPSFMPKLARFAKVLGPKGLMPNPKAGTISPKPEEVAKKFEGGLMKWKGEAKFPLVHQMIGKLSADDKNLVENAEAFIAAVGSSKIKSVFIKSTMSPSLQVSLS